MSLGKGRSVTEFVLPGSELVYKHSLFAYTNRYKYYYLISNFQFLLDKPTVHYMSLASRIPRSGTTCRAARARRLASRTIPPAIHERGTTPSSTNTCQKYNNLLNVCAQKLTISVGNLPVKKKYKSVLRRAGTLV